VYRSQSWESAGDSLRLKEETRRTHDKRVAQMRHIEEENARLKRLAADLTLDKVMLQDLLSRKL